MLNFETRTKLSKEEVAERLKKFFGKGGLELKLCEDTLECLSFEGAGGYVTASLGTEAGKTRITLVTQEWDQQVKKFAASLP